jgi:hypothetical protein
MLGSRKITAMLAGENLEGSVARGCPQAGILLPLLWSLVVDKLIGGLNGNGYYTLGYADDIAIPIHGKFPNTVSELLQEASSMVQQWCDRTQLSIKPQKMVIISFTQKRDLRGLKNQPSPDTLCSYRGQIPWTHSEQGIYMEGTAVKCHETGLQGFLDLCKGTFGKTWGLKPRVVLWIYTMVIRPILTYSSTVWWPRVRYNVSRTELSKIQRLTCLAHTGVMKATSTAAMEIFLGLPPLHVMIEEEAQAGTTG